MGQQDILECCGILFQETGRGCSYVPSRGRQGFAFPESGPGKFQGPNALDKK